MKCPLAVWVFAVLVLGMLAVPLARSSGGAPTPPGKPRIGVYDSRAVAVAYVRGSGDAERIRGLMAELKQAEAKGDKARAEQIKAQGARIQTLRHLQGFSNAPIDDILQPLAGKLPEIARAAGVSLITAHVDFSDDSVEVVDVTDRIVAEFSPDERTLKMIADLRKLGVTPLIDVLAMNPKD